jgi:hypothetical protein
MTRWLGLMTASLSVGSLVLLRSKHGAGQLHGTPVVLLDLVASIDRRRSGGSRRGWHVVWCSKKGGCRVVFIGRGYRCVAQGSSNRFQLTRTLTRMRFDRIRERDKTQFMTIPIRLQRNPLTLRLKHGSTDRRAPGDMVGCGE